MICPLEDRVLRLDAGPLSEAERRALIRHSEGCSHCKRALESVAAAREVLKAGRRPPHPSARVRVWARIESERRRAPSLRALWTRIESARPQAPSLWARIGSAPRGARPLWALAAVTAAMIAVVVLARFPVDEAAPPRLARGRLLADGVAVAPGRSVPARAVLVAKGPVRIVAVGADLELAPGTALRLLPYESAVAVDLTAGELSVSALRAPPAARVRTRAVSLTVLAGRVTLRVQGQIATVRVERGRARAEVPGGSAPEWLEAGTEQHYGVRSGSESRAPPAESRRPAPKARRPPSAPRPPPKPPDDAKTLEAARAVLPAAPKRARAMAEEVLNRRPEARLEVEALALMADAERRSGRLRDALRSYGRVVDHPRGETYAEEALFRQAILHARLGEPRDALAKLETGARRFAGGVLAPERAALEAKLHLDAGRPEAAARALERVPEAAASLAIARRRVEVAEALRPTDPARAAQLAAPALDAPDPKLRRRAANLMPPGGRARARPRLDQKTR